jgi:hypothetical protein
MIFGRYAEGGNGGAQEATARAADRAEDAGRRPRPAAQA